MKRSSAITASLLIICLCWWWFKISENSNIEASKLTSNDSKTVAEVVSKRPNSIPSAQTGNSASSGTKLSFAQRMKNAFSTSITFYGRVLDQHGAPVPGATVQGSAAVSMGGDSTKTKTTTDASGKFTLNSKGMSFFVSVDKPGYYHIFPNQVTGFVSESVFHYAEDLEKEVHKPDPSKPVNLHLFKPGMIEPLTRLKPTSRRMSRSGEAVEVALDTDQGERHRISLSCKTDDKVTPDGKYSWKFEVKVISGGLQRAGELFEFEAPASGYKEGDVIDMSDSIPRSEWSDSVQRSYFVRFDDDTFARMKVEMISFGDHFATIEGYHNPKVGSRNLEADPSQR
jgi:hypothetical protein